MNIEPTFQHPPVGELLTASTRKRRINIIIFGVVTIAILAYFALYIAKNYEQLTALVRVSPLSVAGLGLLVVGGFVCLGLQNLLLYRRFSVFLSLKEAVGLAAINTLGNLLPVSGGMLIKGYYLREKHNLAYSHFFPSLLALFVCFFAVSGLVGLLGLIYWDVSGHGPIPYWLYGAFLLMAAGIITLWLPMERIPLPRRIAGRMSLITDGWRLLGRSPVLLFQQSVIHVVSLLLFSARFYIVFRMMSQGIPFTVCVIISAATILTHLVIVVPGGIGIREAIVAGLGAFLGFDFGISMMVAGVDRLVPIIVAGAVAPIIRPKR